MTGILLATLFLLPQDPTVVDQLRQVVPQVTGRNGYEEYVGAAIEFAQGKGVERLGAVEALRGTEEFLPAARALVQEKGRVFQLVQQGNQKPVVYPRLETADVETLMPELSVFRQVGRLYALKMEVDLAAGNVLGAYGGLLQSLIFARQISGSGVLINALVGNAISAIAFSSYGQTLPPDLQSCQRLIAGIDGLLNENAALTSLQGEQKFMERSLAGDYETTVQMLLDEEDRELPRATIEQAFRDYVTDSQRQTQLAIFVLVRQDSEWLPGLKEAFEPMRERVSVVKSLTVDGSMAWNMVLHELRYRTQLRLLRYHAAIWGHRWLTGAFPAERKELRNGHFGMDPVTGKEFFYERDGNQVVVWADGGEELGEVRLDSRGQIPGMRGDEEVLPPETVRLGDWAAWVR